MNTSSPGARRDEVAHVQRVAVVVPGRALAGAVVVDGHRAVDDLLPGVGVDVGDGQAVRALAGERVALRVASASRCCRTSRAA